jgi:two-component system chemotaxis response regulator CheB
MLDKYTKGSPMPEIAKSAPDIVAIGASAGGLEAIEALLMRLPPDLPAALLIAMHQQPQRISYLPEVLARMTEMRVVVAAEGDRLESGTCYIGLPNLHLTVGPGGVLHLLPDSFYRAHNIDVLFQSLALHVGARTIGVIMSGMLKDGSVGLKAIKEAGGVALVQSPQEALYKEMPQNAIETDGSIDCIGSVGELAREICRRVGPSGR